MSAVLERTTFQTSRVLDFFSVGELTKQTGQPVERFADVVLKELVDNALDAAEAAGVAPEVRIESHQEDGQARLVISDNGPGIPSETVEKLMDFTTRTSDKAAYRAPTRGAQGNAWATILGIPVALSDGEAAPEVVIAACGVCHTIRIEIDPAGEPRTCHDTEPWDGTGTRIEVGLPWYTDRWGDLYAWDVSEVLSTGFALFNPHARFILPDFPVVEPSVDFPADRWRKFLPTDLTSPHWYGREHLERLIFSHIKHARDGGKDLTLRELVRQFRGLSGNAKAKQVVDRFAAIGRLSDFEAQREWIGVLLHVMCEEAKAPRPNVLGLVGEDHLRRVLDVFCTIRDDGFDYRKKEGEAGGLPYVLEVAVADTEERSGLWTGLNFSPTYEDPFAGVRLTVKTGTGPESGSGMGVLYPLHCRNQSDHENPVAVVVHLSCPGLEFQDRGKTRVALPAEMVEALQETVWKACKRRYKVQKSYEQDRRREWRAAEERTRRHRNRHKPPNQKAAVFEVMEEAVKKASGGGRFVFPTRNLYYAVRPLVQDLGAKVPEWNYFSQTLVTEWEEKHGAISGLYRDPRGHLYEPHTGASVALGTLEVDDYDLPEWVYDKVLYVEKKGLFPILKSARLGERYDLAIIAAEGYATRAARVLLARAKKGADMTILALHDADPYGYNIARTLQEATRAMPDHHVEVADIGLRIEEALQMGLQEEEFVRTQALPAELVLTEGERECFEGIRVNPYDNSWRCRRVELNAFDPDPLIAYIESELDRVGCARKLVPPEDVLKERLAKARESAVRTAAREMVETLLDVDILAGRLAQEFLERVDVEDMPGKVDEWAQKLPSGSWEKYMQGELDARACALEGDLKKQALVKIQEMVKAL